MRDFNHAKQGGDFGYTWCHACGGDWEGPEKPSNSPCSVEAQQIRKVREGLNFYLQAENFEEAAIYLDYAENLYTRAFDEGGLKKVYWNSDGSTL